MKQQMQNNEQTETSQQGLISEAKTYLNEERGTLTHVIGDQTRIVMPINYYKKVLGIPFTPIQLDRSASRPKSPSFGLQAQASIYLSKDGRFLIHRVLGVRISKHVNYYKKILGAEFTPDIRVVKTA